MRLIDADRLLTDRMKSKYYHLPNGDIAIPIIDIEHAPTIDAVEVARTEIGEILIKALDECEISEADKGHVIRTVWTAPTVIESEVEE